MVNKNMSDVGLTCTVDDFCTGMDEAGLMKDLTIPPQPPVVGMAVDKIHLNLSMMDIKAAFVGAQDVDVASGAQGEFKQGENKKAQDKLTMGNANHQIGFEEFLNALALCGHIKFMETGTYKSKDSRQSTMEDRVKGIFDMFAMRLPGAGQSFLSSRCSSSRAASNLRCCQRRAKIRRSPHRRWIFSRTEIQTFA